MIILGRSDGFKDKEVHTSNQPNMQGYRCINQHVSSQEIITRVTN